MFKIPFETEVLPIANTLNVDKKLQLSNENLLDDVRSQIKVEKLAKVDKLKSIREFPSTGILADLAWKAYENLDKVKLPDGWKLLTLAANREVANGYYGAAFWHPDDHQCVVAHRGTELSNIGAVVADIAGIVFNNYGPQMESACTFVDQIVKVLKTVEDENEEVHFELFLTGHSLGGWLGQVTAFTNAFLTVDNETFIRLESDEIYHAQAVVFDSPGCLPMLQKLKNKFETPETQPIVLESLSITSYLSAPNQVNTCNEHFGKVFRIFIDTSKMNFMNRNVGYTLMMHSIENIVKFFNPERENQVQEVIEWPVRKNITDGQELENFLKYADHRNHYHIRNILRETAKKIQIRYKTKRFDNTLCPISTFSKREKQFLEHLRWVRQLPEYAKLKKLFEELSNSKIIESNIVPFDIIDQDIRVSNSEQVKLFIPHVKLLLKLFPQVAVMARNFLLDETVRGKVFAFETNNCVDGVRKDLLDFKPSTIDLSKMFEKQFSHLKIISGRARNGLSMVYKTFEKSEFKKLYGESSLLVVDLKRFIVVNELVDVRAFLDATTDKKLTIVYSEGDDDLTETAKASFVKLFEALKEHPESKTIIIGDAGNETVQVISQQAKEKLGEGFYEVEKSLSWDELTSESQQNILGRSLSFQGRRETLKNLMSSDAVLNDKVLMQLLNDENLEINTDPFVSCDFSVYTTDHEKRKIKPKYILESLELSDDIFVISGLYDDIVQDVAMELKNVVKPRDEKEQKLIDNNIVIGGDKLIDTSGKLHIVSLIGSDKCLEDFNEKCRNFSGKVGQSVHWLKIKGDDLVWRKSFNYESHVDRKLVWNSRTVTDTQLCDEIYDNEKLVVINGPIGDGKSAFLTHLARKLSAKSFVFYFNFNDLSFDGLDVDNLDHESLCSFFLSAAGYDTANYLQTFLVRHKISSQAGQPMHFLFDGFDDILSDKKRIKAVKLLSFMKNETTCCVTLTLRDEFMSSLNDLQPSVCTFDKIERTEREKLVKEIWRSRLALNWGAKKCAEIFDDNKKSKFKNFSKILLDQLDVTIDNKAGDVMGVPQQLRLLAAGFQEDFEKYVQLNSIKQKIIEGLKLKTFYQRYVNTKYDLYVTAKARIASVDQKGKGLLRTFQNISVDSLLSPEIEDLLNNKSEYLSSDYIILQITKGQSPPKFLSTLTGYLLTDSRCEQIRSYLNKHDDLLPRTASYDVTDEIAKGILGQPMITCCKEGHDNIIKFLTEILKKKPDLGKVELGKDESKKNAINYAIENCHEKCVKVLVDFLSENGDREELANVLREIDDKTMSEFLTKCENREEINRLLSSCGVIR